MKQLYIFILIVLVAYSKASGQNLNYDEKNQALIEKLDHYLSVSASNGFNGAVTIVKDGTPILNKGYGFANKTKPPCTESAGVCKGTKVPIPR